MNNNRQKNKDQTVSKVTKNKIKKAMYLLEIYKHQYK